MNRVLSGLLVLMLAPVALAGQSARPQQVFSSGAPTTTSNDDSCDIALLPAATLLVPYFEVSPTLRAVDTFVTVTNTSPYAQIVQMTIWTDRSFPVASFPLFLTGYDVLPLSLYDVLINGIIAPSGPGSGGTSSTTPAGARSQPNGANPNLNLTNCQSLPGLLAPQLRSDLQRALTTGSTATQPGIGNVHANAIGSVTFDVVASCGYTSPADPTYYSNVLLFDNVLVGDCERIVRNGSTLEAVGAPMVHIRAIPEGGQAGMPAVTTNLPFTFYDRFTPAASRKFDRRQPLPSTFAARSMVGSALLFDTTFELWREGTAAGSASDVTANASVPVTEVVRFDDSENATISIVGDPNGDSQTNVGDVFYLLNALFAGGPALRGIGDANGDGRIDLADVFALLNFVFAGGPAPGGCGAPPCRASAPSTSAVAAVGASDPTVIPPQFTASGDVGGWVYFNLNNGGSAAYGPGRAAGGPRATVSQNWVVTRVGAQNVTGKPPYAYETTAPALGNGCTPNSGITSSSNPIAPAANATP